MPLDPMSPETHRRIEYSLARIDAELSPCHEAHVRLLEERDDFGMDDYGVVVTAEMLEEPIRNPLFRLRVRQMLSRLNRLAVGVERYAIDFDVLNASEGCYIAGQAWRWHVFVEMRRRRHPGFEQAFAPLQRVTARIAAERRRSLPPGASGASRQYWEQVERWASGDGSEHVSRAFAAA